MAADKTAMTEAEYLEASKTWKDKHEWVGGQAWAMTGARTIHNAVAMNVGSALKVALRGGPCRPVSGDQRTYVESAGTYFYADVTVLCGPAIHPDHDPMSIVNPTVLIEVLSPTTRDYDLGTKLEHYRTIATLRDMVFIDPDRSHVIHYARIDEGWLRRDLHDGALVLTGLDDCRLPLDAVYDDLDNVAD